MGENEKEARTDYIRISAVNGNPEGKRPEVQATAYAKTPLEWDELRSQTWEQVRAYIGKEPQRRKIAAAAAREAKAAAERKELEAQTGA